MVSIALVYKDTEKSSVTRPPTRIMYLKIVVKFKKLFKMLDGIIDNIMIGYVNQIIYQYWAVQQNSKTFPLVGENC